MLTLSFCQQVCFEFPVKMGLSLPLSEVIWGPHFAPLTSLGVTLNWDELVLTFLLAVNLDPDMNLPLSRTTPLPV